jgi:ABC-type transport system substrate-binding protein
MATRPTRRDFLRAAGIAGTLSLIPLGSTVLLEACGTTAKTASTGKAGGVLQFGLSSYPPNFNPFVNTGAAAQTVSYCVHRGLVSYDANGNLVPEVARSWKVKGDQEFTFSLRTNARFHSGNPVTADDVIFSIQHMQDPASGAYLLSTMQQVESAVALDDHTVKLTLRQPDAAFLQALADPHAPIVSKKSVTSNPTAPFVGLGPFQYQTQEQGTKVTVVKFPGFYKPGLPKLDGIDFVAYADDNLRVSALESRTVDMIDYVPWQDYQTIRSNPALRLAETTYGAFMYLVFNVTKPPFNDPRVRQAIGFGCDRHSVVETAFFGQGAVLEGIPVIPSSPYYDSSLAHFWSFDPSKAKQMLAAAGYPDGLSVTLLSTAQYGMHKDTAIAVQASLGKAGVKVTLQMPDWPTRVTLGNQGAYQFAVMGSSGDYNDPDYLTAFLSGGPYYARSYGFNDPTIDSLLAQGRATLATTARRSIYNQVLRQALAQSPLVGLTWRPQAFGVNKRVGNFHALPGFLIFDSMYSFDTTTLG